MYVGMTTKLAYFGLVLLVTPTVSNGEKYIGCYREISLSLRLMSDHRKDFPGTLTVDICIDECKENGFAYAGLQYGHECFCSLKRPSYTYLADNRDCKMKCEGDESQTCGNGFRLSVYDIEARSVNNQMSKYHGCFKDSINDRTLPNKMFEFPTLLTPEYCIGNCWRLGYRYAGVEFSKECHCGDFMNSKLKADDSDCSKPCTGDNNLNCGGGNRISIYETGIPDRSSDDNLIGCFKDEAEVRLLSGYQLDLKETNTPSKCLSICFSLGYKYSGVQYKFECFCGNRQPQKYLEVGENDCQQPCPGDSNEHCGGNYRLLVFKTGKGSTDATVTRPSTAATTATITPTVSAPDNTPIPLSVKKPPPPKQGSGGKNPSQCKRSLTEVNGKPVCQGALLFSDDFALNTINKQKWNHNIFMPWDPDYEFVVFTKKATNSFVRNGKLVIKPTIFEDDFVRRGKLVLQDCSGELYTEECERQAVAFSIIPPIESARLDTKESFSFKYGRVDIRAKLPAGDWIIPELWLEPKRRIYGRDYNSGRIRVASARGNIDLKLKSEEIGNKLLDAGVLVGLGDQIKGRSILRKSVNPWSASFHNYTLIWTPTNITFSVDGNPRQGLIPKDGGMLSELVGLNNSDTWCSASESKIAPFDQEFYLSLGLSVGGMRNFPDDSFSNGIRKPWKNFSVKGMANFYSSKTDWSQTWSDDSALQIDYIKVTAL